MSARRFVLHRRQPPGAPRLAPLSPPLRLRNRSLYVMPTGLGASFGLLLAAMLLAAMNYTSSMGHALTFLLTGLALGAIGLGHRNLLGLGVEALAAAPVFAGDTTGVRLRLYNEHRYVRYEIRACICGIWSPMVDLAPGERCEVTVPVPAPERGALRIDQVVIESHHPGRLLRAWSRLGSSQTVLVYPRPHPGAPPLRRVAGTRKPTRHSQGEDDFAGLRRFDVGDPPRRIDWKAYARGADLQVKQFTEPVSESRWLCFRDVEGGVEERLSRLCRQALDAERRGESFGLQLPGLTVPPASGRQQLERVLGALALHPGQTHG